MAGTVNTRCVGSGAIGRVETGMLRLRFEECKVDVFKLKIDGNQMLSNVDGGDPKLKGTWLLSTCRSALLGARGSALQDGVRGSAPQIFW